MCLKRALKKGGISTVEGISLGCSSKNEKINLQMEITYASLSDFGWPGKWKCVVFQVLLVWGLIEKWKIL